MRMTRIAIKVVLVTLALVLLASSVSASAASRAWSPADLESQLMCPTCHVPLDQSDSAEAQDIRIFIQQRHDAGWSEQRTRQALVDRFGTRILAAPPFQGFDMLAWLLPGVILLGGGAAAVGLALTWARQRNPTSVTKAPPAPEPALLARIQADLEQFE